MQILRAANYKVMLWKNGLGSTTEIAISPASDVSADFDWRVSMAQVTSDGPFSSFPGIDRTLLILEGDGLNLFVNEQKPVRIDRESIHAFPGDQPTSATLTDGPVLDLNIMSRRGVVTHRVRRIKVMASQSFSPPPCMLLFVENGTLTVTSGDISESLSPRDAVLIDQQSTAISIASSVSADVIIATFG